MIPMTAGAREGADAARARGCSPRAGDACRSRRAQPLPPRSPPPCSTFPRSWPPEPWPPMSSIGTEPATAELLDVLRSRKVRVLLPVLRDDLDLDWAIYAEPGPVVARAPGAAGRPAARGWAWTRHRGRGRRAGPGAGRRRGRHPAGPRRRLLRPGAAAGPAGRPVVALLHDGELLPAVPAEPHDRQVSARRHPVGCSAAWGTVPG